MQAFSFENQKASLRITRTRIGGWHWTGSRVQFMQSRNCPFVPALPAAERRGQYQASEVLVLRTNANRFAFAYSQMIPSGVLPNSSGETWREPGKRSARSCTTSLAA